MNENYSQSQVDDMLFENTVEIIEEIERLPSFDNEVIDADTDKKLINIELEEWKVFKNKKGIK